MIDGPDALRTRQVVVLLDRGRVRYSGDLDGLRRTLERPTLELVAATAVAPEEPVPPLSAADVARFDASRRVQQLSPAHIGPRAMLARHTLHVPDALAPEARTDYPGTARVAERLTTMELQCCNSHPISRCRGVPPLHVVV